MIHSTIRIVTFPEKNDEAVTILSRLAARIRVMSGCIACRAYRDAEDECALMLEAIWENETDMKRHLRSEEFRKALFVVEMSKNEPEIRFEEFSIVSGIETIMKARRGDACNT